MVRKLAVCYGNIRGLFFYFHRKSLGMFSVCALFYGDYPQLAGRLLDSLSPYAHVLDFRFGLNQAGAATRKLLEQWALEHYPHQPVYFYESASGENLGKYPLMRQMLRDRPLAERVMWFDDDSYLDPSAGQEWWDRALAVSRVPLQVGALHLIMQRGRQHEVIVRQPWYGHKPLNARHRFSFVTGGWWIARSEFLLRWDYPFPALYHNGGDSILGELLRQQGQTPSGFPGGLQCHCESCAGRGVLGSAPVVHINVGGRRGRRGLGVVEERYVWADGETHPDLSHHSFTLRVSRYEV
jgi:hypothetical protein